MIKLTAFLPRIPSKTREEFISYHREIHAPLLQNNPFARSLVKRYEQAHNIGATVPGITLPDHFFDGIAELWFDSLEDLSKFYTGEPYLSVIRLDELRFIDLSRIVAMISTVNVVF